MEKFYSWDSYEEICRKVEQCLIHCPNSGIGRSVCNFYEVPDKLDELIYRKTNKAEVCGIIHRFYGNSMRKNDDR